jgi:hypothetical protein
MDAKTTKILGALFVLVPMLWGAVAKVISVYDRWIALTSRVERIERWRCAMGSKPQGSTEWPATDWQRECPARSAPSPER